jgi:MFS family permease
LNSDKSSPSPQSFAALRHKGFRTYFFLTAITMMADNIEHVISYWLIFQKFQSPALAGFAVIAHWLPFLFFALWSGALADRYDPRRMIQIGMGMFIFVSLAWGYLFATDTLEMWHAAVLLVIHGFAGVFWNPAAQLLLYDIVGPAQLQSAVRLSATAFVLGRLAGPAVGGALMLTLGPIWGLMANALIYLPMTIWLIRAPYGPKFRSEPRVAGRAVRSLRDVLGAMRDVAHNRVIVSMTLLAGFASLFVAGGYSAQMPEFAHDLGHGDADFSYSMLLAADAAGALIAGIALESRGLLRPRVGTALVLAMVWCVAMGAFALSGNYVLALALLVVAGFLELAFSSMAQTLVQLAAPDTMRGRVIGLFHMSSAGMRAFSGVSIGLVGSLIGIHWSLALSSMCLLAVIAVLFGFAVRTRPPP